MLKIFGDRKTELENRIRDLEIQIKELHRDKEDLMLRRFSVMDTLDESIPEGATERRAYMTDVTNFYVRVFRKKIPHFISMQLDMLSKMGQTERQYDVYRSNINVFYLIDDWMQRCEREYLGDLEAQRDDVTEDLEFVEKLKGDYITHQ